MKLLLSLLFTLITLTSIAQVAITTSGRGENNDGVVFVDFIGYDISNPQNSSSDIIELRKQQQYKGHIALVEFGFSNFTTPNYNHISSYVPVREAMDINMAKSIYIGWNLFTFSAPLNKANTLGISTAFGLAWHNFVFENNYTLSNIGGELKPMPIDPSYKKSKYNTFSIRIPVVLEYNITRKFFVSAGLYADILINSQTKIKEPIEKHKGNLYSNPIGAGATARIGYNRFYLLGNYSFVNVFNKNRAPKTQAWTIGVGLGF